MLGNDDRDRYPHSVLRSQGEANAMTPTVKYRVEDNAAYIRFSSAKIRESEEISPGIVFDFDKNGHIVGIELLDARAKLPPDLLATAA
jgi:uncharacterized protein YuzE